MSGLTLFTLLVQVAMAIEDNRVITTLKYSNFRVKPTVVNGEAVNNTRVPYLVSIKEINRRVNLTMYLWTNLCGGSIIGEDKVLTAAHCFEANHFFYAKRPDRLRVIAGNTDTDLIHSGDYETNPIGQWRRIDRIIIHRDFVFPMNDISLVFTDAIWIFTDFVDYIVPAVRTADYPSTCFSAGYGQTGHGLKYSASSTLLLAPIKVLTRWHCSVLWEMSMNTFVCTDSEVSDVSNGDSGGPLACYGTIDAAEEPGRDVLVGIVSGKNFDKTTLYTRVSSYHDWILRACGNKIAPSVQLTIIFLLLIYLLFLFN